MKKTDSDTKQFVPSDGFWEIYVVIPAAGHIAADVAKNKYFDRRDGEVLWN